MKFATRCCHRHRVCLPRETFMLKILISSDLHLSDTIWKHRPIFDDSYFAWRQITELAIENDVDAVILAGDVLDKQYNVSQPVHRLVQLVRALEDRNIPVMFIQGQHELMEKPWIKIGTEAIWLNEKKVKLKISDNKQLTLVGCDFKDRNGFQEFLASDLAKQADVLVCHQVWLEFMGEMGKPQASFSDVPKNVKCLITGDYHQNITQVYRDDLTVISPGSTHMRSISEPPDKYVVLMTIDNKGKMSLKNIPLQTREFVHIDLKTSTIDKHVTVLKMLAIKDSSLPELIKKPLVLVSYDAEQQAIFDQKIMPYADKLHIFSKCKKHGSDDYVYVADEQNVSKVGLLGMLPKLVPEDSLEYELALQLLQAGDKPDLTLETWFNEKLKCT